jgi:hypothetical protein
MINKLFKHSQTFRRSGIVDIKNLMGKLKTTEQPQAPDAIANAPQVSATQMAPQQNLQAPIVEDSILGQMMPSMPQNMPQVPKMIPQIPQIPQKMNMQPIQPAPQRFASAGPVNDDGVILDLGEGISLVIPIQKRMSLSDFLKVAEKVKALEMLSEEAEHRGQSPLYER